VIHSALLAFAVTSAAFVSFVGAPVFFDWLFKQRPAVTFAVGFVVVFAFFFGVVLVFGNDHKRKEPGGNPAQMSHFPHHQ